MERQLIKTIEEQVAVNFTGRVNVLNAQSKQLLGFILILDGQVIHIKYKGTKGLKAFCSLVMDEYQRVPLDFVVEPEIVRDVEKSIHYPFTKLKGLVDEFINEYKAIEDQRPPAGIKLVINPAFLTSEVEVTETEFNLLCTISDVNKIEDIYQTSELLDYEITKNLVTLRKKNALKVIGSK